MARTAPFEAEANVARYEAWFERHRAAYAAELAALRALLADAPEGRGVEVGVGTGRFAGPLGFRYGVEPAWAMARLAKARGLVVIGGVAEALPLRAGSFQRALLVTTICFVDDLGKTLRECHRALAPGGALLIGLVDRESPLGREYQRRRAENVFYREATFYSTSEVVDALERAGFTGFAFRQTIFRPLDEIDGKAPEPVLEGFGRGSFVAIRAQKPSA